MKGQAAIEYFTMIGLVIVASAVVASLAWQENETTTRVQQANIAINTIASAADSLYAQGPGARTTLNVLVPPGYVESKSSISDNIIIFSISTPGGDMDIIAIAKANITGTPPTSSGMKQIVLETIEGYVNITSS